VMQSFHTICWQSLAFPLGARPPNFSRINHDGTPFQFAVSLGLPTRTLQFLSEAGMPGLSGAERIRGSRDCILDIARCLQTDAPLSDVADLLDVLAPDTHPELLADPAGAFWIGVAFASSKKPQLRIYTNAKWGSDRDKITRLRHFASHFRVLEPWKELENALASNMNPLGTALTLCGDGPPTGRIYFSGYGNHLRYYQELAHSISDASFTPALDQFAECILGDDREYPTPSAVCSFGVGEGQAWDFKFELCAHCLFATDVEAHARLRHWFEIASVDAADYIHVLKVISDGHLSTAASDLHCYIGIGIKQRGIYFTVYLKPRLTGSRLTHELT
jgi:hypothetical protein